MVSPPPAKQGHSLPEWITACVVVLVITIAMVIGAGFLISDGRPVPQVSKPPTAVPEISAANQSVADVAVNFERLMLKSGPELKPFLAMADVHGDDRHLLIHYTPAYGLLDDEGKRGFEAAVAKLWRATKHVREEGGSPDVEFFEDDGDGKPLRHFNRPALRPEPVAIPTGKSEFQRRMEEAAEQGKQSAEENKKRGAEVKAAREREETERAAMAKLQAEVEVIVKLEARAANLLRSAEGLEKSGKTVAATQVYKQIVRDFPGTNQAAEVSKRLDHDRGR